MSSGYLASQDFILTTPRCYMSLYFWFLPIILYWQTKKGRFANANEISPTKGERLMMMPTGSWREWEIFHSTPYQRCKLECINRGGFTEYGWGTRVTPIYLLSERVLNSWQFLNCLPDIWSSCSSWQSSFDGQSSLITQTVVFPNGTLSFTGAFIATLSSNRLHCLGGTGAFQTVTHGYIDLTVYKFGPGLNAILNVTMYLRGV